MRKATVLTFLLIYLLPSYASGASSTASLRGLPGVHIEAYLDGMSEASEITKQKVRIYAAYRLRAAGIKVAPSFQPALIIELWGKEGES